MNNISHKNTYNPFINRKPWYTDIIKEIVKWSMKSIIELDSNIKWNTTTIMVWVHWNELSWINALNRILWNIKIISWKVYFIIANLKALEINQRLYEKNLNRCFVEKIDWETYEDLRAQEIIPYLKESDYLLDVHNTINQGNSIPFLISEYKDLGKYFDVDLVISGFDKLHPGWSDSFMNTIWKIGLCLESWSIYDPKWPEIAERWIINFLKFTKNIDWETAIKNEQKHIVFDNIYKNTTPNFKFAKKFNDFEPINKWQLIWYDWKNPVYSDRNGYIVFTYIPQKIWEECFCLWKDLNF